MAARLGYVFYWFANILAAAIVALGAFVYANGIASPGFEVLHALMFIVLPAIIWGIGRAIRYVLAGT